MRSQNSHNKNSSGIYCYVSSSQVRPCAEPWEYSGERAQVPEKVPCSVAKGRGDSLWETDMVRHCQSSQQRSLLSKEIHPFNRYIGTVMNGVGEISQILSLISLAT